MEPTLQQPQIITGSAPEPVPTKKRPIKLVALVAVLCLVLVSITGWFVWQAAINQTDSETPAAEVAISATGFTPATIKVKKGQEVAWTNQDTAPHRIFTDDKTLTNLDTEQALNKDDVYYYTFEKTGTFTYYDPLAPTQHKGTIIVE